MADTSRRIRRQQLDTLSDNHYILRRAGFDFRRADGSWQHQVRESYDIGDGAAVLPFDRVAGSVLLIRQFRWPAFEHGYRDLVTEVIAGKLDGDSPEACAVKEAREEAGVELSDLRQVFHCFMSPGAVKERLHLFVADYDSTRPRGAGAGILAEGEDIETLELSLEKALAMAAGGEIIDAKTILLLQWAALHLR
jgi:nudix-type nucleoside diphosphatase (YffH/AdpP family)